MIPMLVMPAGFLILVVLLVSSSRRRKSEKIQMLNK
jgi:hypothetical protein